MSFKVFTTYKRILIRHIYTSVISWCARARKHEGDGVLREGILCSSSQFVRAVCEKLFPEKLFSEKLFSEHGCLREAVLEIPLSERPFYECQPRSCSSKIRSTRSGSALPRRGYSHPLHTYRKPKPRSKSPRLKTDDHNWRIIMETLAKVGATSNCLW